MCRAWKGCAEFRLVEALPARFGGVGWSDKREGPTKAGRVRLVSVVLMLLSAGQLMKAGAAGCWFTFDETSEGFVKQNDQPRTDVSWDGANKRIKLHVDRRDNGVEMLAKSISPLMTPVTSFTITARWRATSQGNSHNAAPLVLAPNSYSGAGFIEQSAGTFGILYYSLNSLSTPPDRPLYILFYRDRSSVTRLWHLFYGVPDTEYKLVIGYEVTTQVVHMEIRSDQGIELARASYRLGSILANGFLAEKLFVGSNLTSDRTIQPTLEAWVDDVTVERRLVPPSVRSLIPVPDISAGGECSMV